MSDSITTNISPIVIPITSPPRYGVTSPSNLEYSESLRNLYREIEKQGDGTVSITDLVPALQALQHGSQYPSDQSVGLDATKSMRIFQQNNGVGISENEFMQLAQGFSSFFGNPDYSVGPVDRSSSQAGAISFRDIGDSTSRNLDDSISPRELSMRMFSSDSCKDYPPGKSPPPMTCIDESKCEYADRSADLRLHGKYMHPNHPFLMFWEILLFVLVIYCSVVVPFRMSFGYFSTDWGFFSSFDVFIDIIFILDIILRFRMGYFRDGSPVTDSKKIKKKYLRGWFYLDVAASLPLDFVQLYIGHLNPAFRLNKLLRLAHVIESFSSLERVPGIPFLFLRMIKLLFLSLLVVHIVACLWFYFAVVGNTSLFAPSMTLEDKENPMSKYVYSVFWATGIMCFESLNSDGPPEFTEEMIFSTIVMLFGLFGFAYIITQIDHAYSAHTKRKSDLGKDRKRIAQLLDKQKVPEKIRAVVGDYFNYAYARNPGAPPDYMLSLLPSALRSDASMSFFKSVINCSLFSDLSRLIKTGLVCNIFLRYLVPGEILYTAGEPFRALFFIQNGKVELIPADGESLIEEQNNKEKIEIELQQVSTQTQSSHPSSSNDLPLESNPPLIRSQSEIDGTSGMVAAPACLGQYEVGSTYLHTARVASFAEILVLPNSEIFKTFCRAPKKDAEAFEEKCKSFRNAYLTAEDKKKFMRLHTRVSSEDLREDSQIISNIKIPSSLQVFTNWLKNEWSKPIDPRGRFRSIFVIILLLIIVFNAFYIPFRMGFHPEASERYWFILAFDILFDIFLWIDIALNTRVVRNNTGEIETDTNLIASKYFHGWMLIDILASIPLDMFAWSLHPMWRMNRLLRSTQIKKLMREIIDSQFRILLTHVLAFLTLFLGFLMIAHWYACIYGYISNFYGYGSNSYVIDEFAEDSVMVSYFFSIYFTLDNMLRLGFNISPHHDSEVVLSTFMILTGHFVAAFIIGRLADLLSGFDALNRDISNELLDVGYMLRKMDFKEQDLKDINLKRRIIQYFQYRWAWSARIGEFQSLNKLPRQIHRDILMHIFKNILNLEIFDINKDNNKEDISKIEELHIDLVSRLSFQSMPAHEHVYRYNDLGNEVWFLTSGEVELCCPIPGKDHEVVFGTIKSSRNEVGDFTVFGQDCIFESGTRRLFSVRTRDPCELAIISYGDLRQLVDKYPILADNIKDYTKRHREAYNPNSDVEIPVGQLITLLGNYDFPSSHISPQGLQKLE